jgi:molybdenum cofactor cytidylyltransferase
VAAAEASQLDRVVVVTGAYADEVEERLTVTRATVVRNPDFRRGNMSSFRRGVAAAGSPDAVLLLLGDMPEIDRSLIDRFVKVWEAERPWAAVAEYDDGLAHPLLLSTDALEEVLDRDGRKVLWRFIEAAAPAAVRHVRVGRARLLDVNTPADYRELIERPVETDPSNSS